MTFDSFVKKVHQFWASIDMGVDGKGGDNSMRGEAKCQSVYITTSTHNGSGLIRYLPTMAAIPGPQRGTISLEITIGTIAPVINLHGWRKAL